MTTSNQTPQTECLQKILLTTASAFGIKLIDRTRLDPKILASEFKDPIKFFI